MRSLLTYLMIISGIISVNAQETEILYLSGTDKDNTVQWDFFCTSGSNSGKWGKINVPSNWELQGYGTYHYGKTDLTTNEKGLYKYEFTVPEKWNSERVFIVFEGSMTDTEVRINGRLAGPVHQGAFYRFKYDITDLLDFRKQNLLEVAVSKESSNKSINGAERMADYWVFGGIFRPVYLEAVPAQFIDRVAIDARADGYFHMDVFTLGNGKATTLTAQVHTLDGGPVGMTMSVPVPDDNGKVTIKGRFNDPLLWSPEFPNLYTVTVSLNNNDKPIHSITQKFGFRTIEERLGDGFYINGRKIIFKGVCRHTFWPASGRTSSRKLAIEDVNLMKDMNMNAVRMSHYPPDSYFLDVCDSMGMFVLDELAGWQSYYDTPTARRLVKEMVIRDVNHPSIVLWDNGNEGGFNSDVRGDYALYDPQERTVIEPWSVLNGTNTKHYPGYNYVENVLNTRNEIYFPTEFLHGLYDGGLGAGLDDYWKLMTSKPLAAGGFLWVFADEGVERRDLNDSIDTHGNNAPDGILGPYHEKEGSFYTIKEIWSPVVFSVETLPDDFKGILPVTNRYQFTNLDSCRFSFELVGFKNAFPDSATVKLAGIIQSPNLAPDDSGVLKLNLPPNWKDFDVLYVKAFDRTGRNINTWSWNITKPSDLVSKLVTEGKGKIKVMANDSLVTLISGVTKVTFNGGTGLISEVQYNNKSIHLNNGPRFAGIEANYTGLRYYHDGDKVIVELLYDNNCHARWTLWPGGWLQFDYDYMPVGSLDFAGITFSYPENLVKGAVLLADGPYHVWKNRLKGTRFGMYEKKYNNTVTGQSWDYPEFKGYYTNFYAVKIDTKEASITVISGTPGLFLHLFTPEAAKYSTKKGVSGLVNPPFPSGDISFLNGISSIGTKFSGSEDEGPQGHKNILNGQLLEGTLYFRFGK